MWRSLADTSIFSFLFHDLGAPKEKYVGTSVDFKFDLFSLSKNYREPPLEPVRIQTPPVLLLSTDQQLQNNSEIFPSSPPPTPPSVEKKANAPDE